MTKWNLRKEPKIRFGLNLLRGRERALETFGKSRRSGRLGLLEVTDCLDRASEGCDESQGSQTLRRFEL